MRIVVGMSGGVDSSVAAARLLEQGHEVVGATLLLGDDAVSQGPTAAGTGSFGPLDDARLVSRHLGIVHHALDGRERFERRVVQPFVEAYLGGRTPSPCVWCNPRVKLALLLELADRLGADRVATGHYARICRGPEDRPWLMRGRDSAKDQSYFLCALGAEQLARLELPLGEARKSEVRREAAERGLPVASRPESQELCFAPGADHRALVESRARGRIRSGPLLDRQDRPLGRHEGIHRFTVGQRRGLGVALGRPAFVVGIDPARAAVIVGDERDLYARGAVLDKGLWADDVAFPLQARVQVRSQHSGAAATLAWERDRQGGRRLVARFAEAVRAVAPGQALVAYDGDRVLGGATIEAALERAREP